MGLRYPGSIYVLQLEEDPTESPHIPELSAVGSQFLPPTHGETENAYGDGDSVG